MFGPLPPDHHRWRLRNCLPPTTVLPLPTIETARSDAPILGAQCKMWIFDANRYRTLFSGLGVSGTKLGLEQCTIALGVSAQYYALWLV